MSNTGKAIAILGAKGGVGTTTIAVNLAAELASNTDKTVLLLDLNLFLGDVALHIGIDATPTVMQCIHDPKQDIKISALPRHRLGFSLLGQAADLSDAEAVEASDVLALLNRLRSVFDCIVIDCGTDLNEVSLTACAYADDRMIVVTEQRPALIGAKRRMDVLASLNIPGETALGLINRAHADSSISPTAVQQAIGLTIIARVRNAWTENQEALAKQLTLKEHCPHAGVAHDYTQIVRHMGY
jgi:pilus assembly protein CpaE